MFKTVNSVWLIINTMSCIVNLEVNFPTFESVILVTGLVLLTSKGGNERVVREFDAKNANRVLIARVAGVCVV